MPPVGRVLLHAAQARFLESKEPFRGYVGGIGSGKSFVGAYDIIKRAKPGRLYMVIAPTYTLLGDATLRSFLLVAAGTATLKGDFQRGNMRAVLNNGAEVLFRSADNPERLRGPNLSGIWLDEASQMAQDVFDVGIGRLRQAGEQGWLSATFTPKGKTHWTYKTFGPDPYTGLPQRDTFLVHSKTKDNPFLPPNFDDTLRGKYAPVLARQELGGEFMDPVGAMFQKEWARYYKRRGHHYMLDGRLVSGDNARRFSTVDLACSTKDAADWTVVSTWDIIPGPNLCLVDVTRVKVEAPDLVGLFRSVQTRLRPMYFAVEAVASWITVIQYAGRAGLPIRAVNPGGKDKVTHSIAAQTRMQMGQVWFPEPGSGASWLGAFEDELFGFPKSEHDDQVDTLSYAADILDKMFTHGRGHGLISGDGMAGVL